MDFMTLTTTGFFTFGGVWVLDLLLRRFSTVKLMPEEKWLLGVFVAFVVAFIPADFGNEVANRVKDAVSVATVVAGVFQAAKKVAEKV